MLNFDVSPEEARTIQEIALRAEKLPWDVRPNLLQLLMDITGTHCNGCPLNLAGLLAADDFNLAHDIGGIVRSLDRKTGKLTNFFMPRYALRTPSRIDPGLPMEKEIFGI